MTRLIDADALDAEMYHKSFEVDDGRNVWNSGLWIRYKIFEEAIKDAPTIDAVPVVHGKWVKSGRWGRVYRCDQCENYLDFDGVNVGRGDANYCPNCGSYMRGEHDE